MSAYQAGLKLSQAGRHAEAIAQYEQALIQQPDDTKVLFALGNTAQTLGLAGPAEQFFRKILAQEPQRIEALVNLANLLRGNGQADAAIALLAPVAATSPEALITLGLICRDRNELETAQAHFEVALALRPGFPPALANLADLIGDAGDRNSARTLYDQVLKAEPKNAQARLNRAMLHLLNGDLKDGWRDYAARSEIPGKVPQMQKGGEQRSAPWTGGSLRGKRLLVRAEQGVGDQILFASLIPELAARAKADGGSVILECEPRLAPLFARSFPGVTVRPATIRTVGANVIADYGWLKAAGGANTAILMGDLPRYLRGSLDKFPTPHRYLVPDEGDVAQWKAQLGADAIGICWRSGKLTGGRAQAYAPLETWGAMLRQIDRPLVCVQYDAAPDEIAQLEAMSGRKIMVPAGIDQKKELDRACALMTALSLVISAPTAVSWLSSAAGTPTLKLLHGLSWTALGQAYEPFAPACRCVMAQPFGDWDTVAAKTLTLI